MDPRNLAHGTHFSRLPGPLSIDHSSIATYLGVRWDSVPFNFLWNGPSEDVFPIENVDFPASHVRKY